MAKPFDDARALDIVSVINVLELVKYKERNKWRCPNCGTGALHAYQSNLAKCHTCQADKEVFNTIDLTMATLGCDAGEACDYLAERFGLSDVDSHTFTPTRRTYNPPVPRAHTHTRTSALQRVCEITHTEERINAAASHLLTRGITPCAPVGMMDAAAWEELKKELGEGGMQASGLMRDDEGSLKSLLYAFPVLVFSYRNPNGSLDSLRFGTFGESRARDRRKYMSCFDTVSSAPYLMQAPIEGDVIYLCEGEINALSLRTLGLCAYSCSGSGTWQDAWCRIFAGVRVVLVTDGDAGGEVWSAKIIESFSRMYSAQHVMNHVSHLAMPPKKDANDLLMSGLLARFIDDDGAWHIWRDTWPAYALACAMVSVFRHVPMVPDRIMYESCVAHHLTQQGITRALIDQIIAHDAIYSMWSVYTGAVVEEHSAHMSAFGRLISYITRHGGAQDHP